MKKISLLSFSILALLIACSKTQPYKPLPLKTRYNVSVKDTIQLDLSSNSSTGYSWHWMNDSISVVEKISQDYIPHPDKDCNGCSGFEILKFEAKKTGTDTLNLKYYRDRPEESAGEMSVVVEVK